MNRRNRMLSVTTLLCAGSASATVLAFGAAHTTGRLNGPPPQLRAALAQLPLAFEPSASSAGTEKGFLARGQGYTLQLAPDQAVLTLPRPSAAPVNSEPSPESPRAVTLKRETAQLKMHLLGANGAAKPEGFGLLPGKSNYFIGNDKSKWRTNVEHFAKVRYDSVYPGVDVVYHGSHGRLEYDFVVDPGSSPAPIQLSFEGADHVRLAKDGDLVIDVAGGEMHHGKPVIYQERDGRRQPIDGGFKIASNGQVGFEVPSYDHSRPLVIDPYLVYSTYLGGNGNDDAYGVAVDSTGIYVAGSTYSPDFYTSANTSTTNPSYDTTHGGYGDVYVTKFSLDGTSLIYSTYLGGIYGDLCYGLALDAVNQVYLTGIATSPDFPAVSPFQGASGGYDAFIAKVGPTGSTLGLSSRIGSGGDDFGLDVKVDSSSNIYVVGQSNSSNLFAPSGTSTAGVVQPSFKGDVDGFVLKIDSSGAPVKGSYLGGWHSDGINSVAIDGSGNIYLAGNTNSYETGNPSFPGFPTTVGALQTFLWNTGFDGFVTKLDSSLAMSYSTVYGGGADEYVGHVAVDSAGRAFVCGASNSTTPFTGMTGSAYQPNSDGAYDAYLLKFNSSGSATEYGTRWGGGSTDYAFDLKIDDTGKAWMAGWTNSSTDFDLRNPFQATFGGMNQDAFVTEIDTALSGNASLIYSSYLGGGKTDQAFAIARVAGCDSVWVVGQTQSVDIGTSVGEVPFPTNNAFQDDKRGDVGTGYDAFLSVVSVTPNPVANAGADRTVDCTGNPTNVTLDGSGSSGVLTPLTYTWREGGSVIATGVSPTVGLALGVHTITLQVTDTCYAFSKDTVVITVTDTTPPTINTCASNVNQANDAGQCYAMINPGTISATDACSGVTITAVNTIGASSTSLTPSAVHQFDIDPPADPNTDNGGAPDGTSTYTITWTAKDAVNNSSNCISTVTVYDAEAPSFTYVPSTITVSATPPATSALVSPGTAIATDNCPANVLLYAFTDTPGIGDTGDPADLQNVPYPLGDTKIHWLAIDAALNFTEAITTVHVSGTTLIRSNFDVETLGPGKIFTANASTDTLTSTAHGYANATPIKVQNSGGSLPGGLSAATTYYVISTAANTLKLSTSVGGAAVDITSAGSGTNKLYQVLSSGADGWTVSGGGATGPSYFSTGGNPNGYILGTQASATSTLWYFLAPSKFNGNKWGSVGTTLSFDLKQNAGAAMAGGEDVLIAGGGLTIYASLTGPTSAGWSSYSIPLTTAGSWKIKPGGAAATNAQITQVMQSVNSIKIRGKWNASASSTGNVDNVKLYISY